MPDRIDLTRIPTPDGLLDPSGATAIAVRTALLEGPAFDADGALFFSDIIGNRIYRLAPDGSLSVFREDSGRTNGNTFDARGRLLSCEGAEFGPMGRRRVVRTDVLTGRVEVLTDRFEGKRYNSPNDVVVDIRDRIWFTDPFYGADRSALELEERVKDAKALIRGKRWGFAYYVAGYSIECALKSCLLARMIHTAWVFEEKWKAEECRVHDFDKLVKLAGLDDELKARQAISRAEKDRFAAHWATVAAWKPSVRYESRTEAEAQDLLEAVTHKPDGVLRWLKKYW